MRYSVSGQTQVGNHHRPFCCVRLVPLISAQVLGRQHKQQQVSQVQQRGRLPFAQPLLFCPCLDWQPSDSRHKASARCFSYENPSGM
jgi:hypothetical protein